MRYYYGYFPRKNKFFMIGNWYNFAHRFKNIGIKKWTPAILRKFPLRGF
jgi:hypothetical protein